MPFPINPSVGDTYVENNTTYEYLGPVNGWYRKEVDTNNDTTYIGSDGAPGGVSNDTEVIFNDNGSLASDSGLTYDKATGDLTVSGALTAGSLSGPSSFSLGSAASPSVYFGSDTNTGIYSPGADQVAISTNGAERARLTSDGKLGVGTPVPTELLTVNGATPAVLVRTSNAFGNAQVKFNADDINYAGIGLENTALVLRCSNSSTPTERARITADGKLGVGTSNPGYLFHLQNTSGDTNAFAGQSDTAGVFYQWRYNATVASAYGEISTYGGNNDVRIQSQGGGGNTILNAFSGRALVGTTTAVAGSAANFQCSTTANLANVAVYADNAAAKTGGLVDGDVYRTSTGDLKIVYT